MKKLQIGFFMKGCFYLVDEKDIKTNRFFRDSIELANFADRILDKYADRPSVYNKGDFYRYFGNFRPVNRSEHGRSANIKTIYRKMRDITVIYQVEMDAFSNSIIVSSKKKLPKNISISYNRIRGELML